MAEVRHTAKDNVFCNLFGRPEYTLQLYNALHPEDTTASVQDITICTLKTMQSKGIYNDLGFLVKDRLMILVEEQATWSENVAIRALLYLAYSYLDYVNKNNLDLYGKTLKLPKPELYVVYTKKRGNRPDTISIRRDIFKDERCCIEAQVKMLYADDSLSIIDQYIKYCFTFDEQVKIHGYTIKALKETFKICKKQGYLTQYLKEHEAEVIKMMDILFDQERQDRLNNAAMCAQYLARGRSEGIGIGETRGRTQGSLFAYGSLVQDKLITKDIAAQKLGITVEEFDRRIAELPPTD